MTSNINLNRKDSIEQSLQRLEHHTPHAILVTCRDFTREGMTFEDLQHFAQRLCGIHLEEPEEAKLDLILHPDVLVIDTERKILRIDEISDVSSRVQYPPQRGKKRLIIIDRAQRLNSHAANSLLKSLEEPLSSVLFLLTAPSVKDVLPTLTSRCVKVHVIPTHSEVESVTQDLEPEDLVFLKAIVNQWSESSEGKPKSQNGKPVTETYNFNVEHAELLARKHPWPVIVESLVELVSEKRKAVETQNEESKSAEGLIQLTHKLRDWKKWGDAGYNPSPVMRLTELALGLPSSR